MSGLRGNVNTIKMLNKAISTMPIVLAERVAKRSAGLLRDLAAASYSSGETVYSTSRPLGVKGDALSLVASGRTIGSLGFVAIGRIVRAQLNTKYARYLVGKYAVLPMGKPLPASWSEQLRAVVAEESKAFWAEQGQQ